jgi:NAD(P)-dependent dehydrogenase (short-subunit alcohol dehydrogenase family)
MKPAILITGASSGVGEVLAKHLSGRFRVIAVARRLEKMQRAFEPLTDISSYAVDLANPDATGSAIATILERHGPVLYLINNAGIGCRAPVISLAGAELQRAFTINAVAPVTLMQQLLPEMVRHNFGRIVNVTSGAPLNCFAEFGGYSASKAALNALTVTAAKEHAGWNIKINLMSPGPVRTEMAPDAPMSPEVCIPTVEYLLDLDESGPTGRFFWLGYDVPLQPDLEGVDWLAGRPSGHMRRVL